jgi:NADH-quinone oxidoreductase subunit L
MIALILLLPLIVAAVLIGVLKESMMNRYIAVVASLISLLMIPLVSMGSTTIGWFGVGASQFNITILVTPLNLILLGLVAFMATVILLYSSGFMEVLSEQRRFYIEMLLFQVAMSAFAMSGNFIMLFISWEFLSLFSYLLIGFWYQRERASRAAREAVTIILIGDLALLASIAVFWGVFGTLEFSAIMASLPATATPELALGVALLLIAVFTKSAQFPFHEWLTAAMEGPTPVSAFLHSSTMVKAGVFTVIILSPLFAAASAMNIILIFGLVTAVLATTSAMRELHIKKVIAYSTIQELSLMLVAVAGGAVLAAIYFFVVQSFYKALLFFSAGSVMKATNEEDLGKATGLRENKLVYLSAIFGVLSLAGFIPFAGFFAGIGVDSAFTANILVYAIISLIGMGTSFYIFRLFFMSSKPSATPSIRYKYLGQPKTMTYAMLILAALSLLGSAAFFILPQFVTHGFMTNYAANSSPLSFSLFDAIVLTVLVIIGAAAGFLVYGKRDAKEATPVPSDIDTVLYNGRIINAFYLLISRFFSELAEGVTVFDLFVSDFFDLTAKLTMRSGRVVRRASVGQINPYALMFALGIIVLLIYVYLAG